MKVIVSHPGKQHAYRLVNALEQLGLEVTFCTSIAFCNNDNFFKKRIFSNRVIHNERIIIKTFPFLEVLRILSRKIINPIAAQYYFERIFDWFSSNWLKKNDFDIFIGYECAALLCFKVCNERGKISILDLAQIHYNELNRLGKTYDCLGYLLNDNVRQKINKIKDQELRLSSKIFSISSFVRESLIKNNIQEEKIIDLPIGNKLPLSKKEKIDYSNKFEILYVGTVRDQKGVNLLINCLDDIADSRIHFTIIGKINENHYKNLIKERPYISHIPYVPNDLLFEHYQRSDIFVLPSYLDSWGMVVIEAMSNGTPVIITENCGAKDAVKHGGGIIIKTDDKAGLKRAIEFYINNGSIRKVDGMLARENAFAYNEINYQLRLRKIISNL